MTTIDYMKVIDTIAETMGAIANVTMDAEHDKVDRFDVRVPLTGEQFILFSLYLHKYFLNFTMKKEEMTDKEFARWLSKFEYALEQQFFRNIRLERKESVAEYRLEIHF